MTNPCGELPLTGPAGPTGVIVLKKIADDTYEQFGSITLSTTGTTQVTISGTIDPGIGAIENTMTLREDFYSRVNLTATDSVWCFPSGAWGMPKEATTGGGAIVSVATICGAIGVRGNGSVGGSLSYSLDERSFTQKTNSNVNRNPTYWVRWAQAGTGAATRSIGWADAALASDSGNGLFWRHTNAGVITAVAKSAGAETALASSVNAANGVYHAGRMVVALHGLAVQCLLDGADIGTISTNIPTVDLFPSMGTSSTSVNDGLDVDYVALSQDRVVT
jgi:hypothetical protein